MIEKVYKEIGIGERMDWNVWIGKQIFLRTNKDKVYSGIVKEVADVGDGIIFLSLLDKFGQWVTVTVKEIVEIKEEGNDGRDRQIN